MKPVRLSLLLAALMLPATAFASSTAKEPEAIDWRFDGVLGKFDKPSVQRGLQVYKEVCSACHGLSRVPFRRLTDIGFSDAEAKAFAEQYSVMDGPNDDGEMAERPGRPSDHFPSPYANEKAARAMQNGAYPPDLSLIIKAREDGANYVHALLTGFADAPAYRCAEVADGKCVKFEHIDAAEAKAAAGAPAPTATADAEKAATAKDVKDGKDKGSKADATVESAPAGQQATAVTGGGAAAKVDTVGQIFYCSSMNETQEPGSDGAMVKRENCSEMGKTMHYNPYFPGGQIAMPPPLADDQVTYQDDTRATRDQMARDVVNFLQWAAEPEMEARKRMGIKVMIFLGVMGGFFYIVKKRIWSNIEH